MRRRCCRGWRRRWLGGRRNKRWLLEKAGGLAGRPSISPDPANAGQYQGAGEDATTPPNLRRHVLTALSTARRIKRTSKASKAYSNSGLERKKGRIVPSGADGNPTWTTRCFLRVQPRTDWGPRIPSLFPPHETRAGGLACDQPTAGLAWAGLANLAFVKTFPGA
jgi:hypothetical protein